MTKICIFGAGAVGSVIGGRLAAAGADVSLIGRGAHIEAIGRDGLRLDDRGETFHVHPPAGSDPAAFGVQDFVILTTKVHGLAEAAKAIAPLVGPETVIVPAQNGLPWWHFLDRAGPLSGTRLVSLDPERVVETTIPTGSALGCVVIAASTVSAPGHAVCHGGGVLILGEPSGEPSERADRLVGILDDAGFNARRSDDIRGDIWAKLLGNISFSVIAALTGGRLSDLATDPLTAALAVRVMEETCAVAEAAGVHLPLSVEERVAGTRTMGNHKTSILQDLEAGRPMEVDAIAGCVLEIARRTGTRAPTIEAAYALLRRRAVESGLYPPNAAFEALLADTAP